MSVSYSKPLHHLSTIGFKMGLSLISGWMMGITFAPFEIWPLAWIALAPLWYLLCRDRESGFFLNPLCWGLGCYGVSLSWLFGIHPMTWMGVPFGASLAIALFCTIFVAVWGASLVVLWAIGLRTIDSKTNLHPLARVILGTALWCGLERLYALSDLWWTSLALSQSPHNLAILHLGQLSGPSAVVASIVAFNGLVAETFLALYKRRNTGFYAPRWQVFLTCAIGAVTVISSTHLLGYTLQNRPLPTPIESTLNVGLIQGNIGNEIRENGDGIKLALQRYGEGYQDLASAGSELIITPETAIPLTESQLKDTELYRSIVERKVATLMGGFGRIGRSFTTSLFSIAGDGSIVDRYDKWKLVPLGEYIPFEQYLGKFIDRLSPLDAHLQPGKFGQTIDTPFGQAIVGICYDSAYAEHFRHQAKSGDVIFTSSNNAHYGDGMPAQHHAQDLLRAIETDRWLVRVSNTGYSGVIDPHGQTQWISRLDEYTTHNHQIYRQHTQTLYVRIGDWLTPALAVIGLFWWAIL
jgi:apolipoprotein N-acyltransferase